jgi:hypothetical protein
MPDDSPPASRRPRGRTGRPRAKTNKTTPATRAVRRPNSSASPASPGIAATTGSPEPPPSFDHLVADDGFVRDFDRLASNNPKSAVMTALAVGVAVGFVAGLLLARD